LTEVATQLEAAAQAYLAAGLCVLPARRAQKRPAVGRWKRYQKRPPTEAELSAWLANHPDAVCILCGQASGNAEILDFDARGELFDRWCAKVRTAAPGLLERLVLSRTQSDGRHAAYRCIDAVSGNLKLAQRRVGDKVVTLIETRGEGGLVLCAPTPGYQLIQGDLAKLPVLTEAQRDVLLQAAWEFNEYLPPVVDGPRNLTHTSGGGAVGQRAPSSVEHPDRAAENPHIGGCPLNNAAVGPTGPLSAEQHAGASPSADRPGDDFNTRGDPRNVLAQHGWVRVKGGENEYWRRPGKTSGWSATLKDRVFYVFSANAAPFEPNRAYSPFSVYALLNHGGDFEDAARSLRQLGYGGDPRNYLANNPNEADISAIVRMSAAPGVEVGEQRSCASEVADPGPIPEHLFRVPGFVSRVMDFTLANAPYPNVGLAFCGAMALQSYLCGRRVCDRGDLRPNIYLLALASSGTGKDFPRKVNARVLFEIGHVAALGDKFASGEGIQDALARTSAMLFQNDEMDGVLRQINLDRENKRESTPNVLLTLYTSAADVYPMRVKAGQKEAAHIDQPHLTLFGTATPQYFYESLSQRMLTNGFFARLIIVDIGKRGEGQSPGSARQLPQDIVHAARWWSEFQPGTRRANLLEVHPEPRVVPATAEAEEAITALQRQTEHEYDQAHERNDEVARVAWSRTHENAKKLALLYACSENHENPAITLPGVEWATAFAMHQTRRQLFLAGSYVAENPFHAECLKVMRKLRAAPEQRMDHSSLLQRMHMKAADFRELIQTLVQGGEIEMATTPRAGSAKVEYQAV
jgi:hypothetical protein